jgi:hypothetical protein
MPSIPLLGQGRGISARGYAKPERFWLRRESESTITAMSNTMPVMMN